jgi:hypothetical protein
MISQSVETIVPSVFIQTARFFDKQLTELKLFRDLVSDAIHNHEMRFMATKCDLWPRNAIHSHEMRFIADL